MTTTPTRTPKLDFPRLRATVRVESSKSKEILKDATLSVLRNSFRDLVLRLETSKASRQYQLLPESITFHRRFASEGKASLKLSNLQVMLYVTNGPPKQLILFLKALASKLQGIKDKSSFTPKSSRERLLAGVLPSQLSDISPITLAEARNLKTSGGSLPGSTPDTPKTSRRRDAPLLLTPEQKEVLSAVHSGQSLFFTGGAGTGKSFLIKKIIGSLPPDSTFVTASTGVAAHLIGGTTLHSFSGITSHHSTELTKAAEMADKKRGPSWRKCKVLIIDEISMVDGRYFSTLEAAARYIRNSEKPFGGIQLLLTGDFLQLPPVNEGGSKSSTFCFESPAWNSCIKRVVELKTVKRQSDPGFISLLNNIRFGKCTNLMAKTLVGSGKMTLKTDDGICATRLCTHSADVDAINRSELRKLKTPSRVFKAVDSGSGFIGGDKEIELKVGTQVMLTKNISVSEGLVNGARGVVSGFEVGSGSPLVTFKSCGEKSVGYDKMNYRCTRSGTLQTRSQIPLRLAWAFSIHKSQGLTLDFVQVCLSKVFEAGQAYVALSRAKDLNSLRVLNFHPSCVRADPRVVKFYRNVELLTPKPL